MDVTRIAKATDATERMAALCDFVAFWLGERRPEYGEPASALDSVELPTPLRMLYAFAGRWPHPTRENDAAADFAVGAFSRQDSLRRLERIQRDENGKIVFLDENQGVWDCRTLPAGDDPPVWAVGDLFDDEGSDFRGEKSVSESLSKFLVSFVLQELTFSSKFAISDDGLRDRFLAERERAIPLWIDGPYVHFRSELYYWNESIAMASPLSGFFAASSPTGIAFLEANQGAIDRVSVNAGRHWTLEIRRDGSATARYARGYSAESCETAAGASEFSQVAARIESAYATWPGAGDPLAQDYATFFRAGQRSAQGRRLADRSLVESLFERAFAASQDENAASLRKRFFDERPAE